MTDHEYKASWIGPLGNKSCKVCGRLRGAHWKPALDTLTPEEVEAFKLPAHTATCCCQLCYQAYGKKGFHEEAR